ncbi:NAD-dependent epimerase/dehydratase family protein [Microlunatus elymi]|uniref:NAD-dependent epimerase/dehydratase family protein n=1 Tax=Microlunatus elymi TaxID=2596828 RepID=A0A516PZB5_9ACTN|nr:NAD-dependent epimerase/dehydratase family protein [Microlunatus elymi]QDP96331.1 NAD-dependent epimerase/dehydratase family protein [Microlunatus elymi]
MADILFIGGTGIISAAAVRRAFGVGHNVTVLNRGQSSIRPLPDQVEQVQADIREPDTVREALGDRSFDTVLDFVAFVPEHVDTDAELFAGRAGQYVFISSASAYQTPPGPMPVTEQMPLDNPFWQYSRDKIACEQRIRAFDGLDWTIVRPSHTYDRTALPIEGRWTAIDRMRRGLPVVVHGDGTSLWTITHTDDFAVGLVGLLGNSGALGQAIHITNEWPIAWNEIYTQLARAAGVAEPELVHVASQTIAAVHPDWGPGLVGDKAHTMIFDNSLLRSLVPEYAPRINFAEGAAEIIDWYDADPARRQVDPEIDAVIDKLCAIPDSFIG